jgi:hypothetical protein
MSIDLNELPNSPSDVSDVSWDNYKDPTDFSAPLVEGTYMFRTVKAEVVKFEAGIVSFKLDHEVYDPINGAKIGTSNFDTFTTKPFDRQGVPASMAADMLRAAGIMERPSSPREWGELITSIKSLGDQGEYWRGTLQWDGYCAHKGTDKETQFNEWKKPLTPQPSGHFAPFTPRGMKKWPVASGSNGETKHAYVMKCPTCGEDVTARAKISRRIPK